MKTISTSQPFSRASGASRFEAAKAFAFSGAEFDDEMSFIFTEAGQFDSYEHCGHGPYVNLRDEKGNEMICRIGGKSCVPLDERASKLA